MSAESLLKATEIGLFYGLSHRIVSYVTWPVLLLSFVSRRDGLEREEKMQGCWDGEGGMCVSSMGTS